MNYKDLVNSVREAVTELSQALPVQNEQKSDNELEEGEGTPLMESENMDPECMASEIPLGESAIQREQLSLPNDDNAGIVSTIETLRMPPLMRGVVTAEILGRPIALRPGKRGGWR